MLKTPSDLATLSALESTLHDAATGIAETLEIPPSEDRTARLRHLWAGFDTHRITYKQQVQSLRARIVEANRDTPIEAAARRRLTWQGPARAEMWTGVEQLIWRQTLPASFPPLISQSSEKVTGPEFGAINYLSEVLFRLSNPLAGDDTKTPDTHYRDIPLSGAYFLELLASAKRALLAMGHDEPVRFLDMGCGGGSKVLAASAIFEIAQGADFLPEYVSQAQQFLRQVGADPAMIRQADALTFDDYASFDVIYFYRPLKDITLAAKMEARVLSQVRPGTILIAPLNATLGRAKSSATRLVDRLYIAHMDREAVQEIAEKASQKGCESRLSAPRDGEMLGFWEPIIRQSRHNGFHLI